MPRLRNNAVEIAMKAMRAGSLVLLIDDVDRENEGDLVVAAELATPALINTMITEGRGLLCVALAAEITRGLELSPMVAQPSDPHGTAFTVSVDLVGTGTGISASARSSTIRALADPTSRPADFTRPGHVFPLRAKSGGVLSRQGHTEASVDLAELAGLTPAAAICEVLDDAGMPAGRSHLLRLAGRLQVPVLDVGDLVAHRRSEAVRWTAGVSLPTPHGPFVAHGYGEVNGLEHLVLVLGSPLAVEAPMVRIHRECITGDVLGSVACGCSTALRDDLQAIRKAGAGVLIYLRDIPSGIGAGVGGERRLELLRCSAFGPGSAGRDIPVVDDILRRLRVQTCVVTGVARRIIRRTEAGHDGSSAA
jgi:3,4-dihydroxy 2-butanone 4-phosphate synthase/GTP cyclohydrolase II